MRSAHACAALANLHLLPLLSIFAAVQHEDCRPIGARNVWGWSTLHQRRPTMSSVAHSASPTLPTLAERKPNPLVRLVRAVVDARTRMYLAAVTDPATGRIDPDLEQRVLRMMAL